MKNQDLKPKQKATIKQNNDAKVISPELDKISIEELNKVSGGQEFEDQIPDMGYGQWW